MSSSYKFLTTQADGVTPGPVLRSAPARFAGLLAAIATDYMYRRNTMAIGNMMKDLKYTGGNTDALEKHIDYSLLEVASGKKKEALGFNAN